MGLFGKKKRQEINIAALIGNVQQQLLVSTLGVCLTEGISVNFWVTKDRSAVAINLWRDGEKENFYCQSSEEMERVLNMITDEVLSSS